MEKKNHIKDQYAQAMNYIGVSLIWLFVSLAGFLLTLGAATTAAFHTVFAIGDRGRQVKLIETFLTSFKTNFFFSTLVYWVTTLLAIGLFFIYNFATNTDQTWIHVFVYISVLELVLFNLYVYPLLAVFKHPSLGALIKNTILMAHFHLFTTLKLIGSLALFVWLIVRIHPAFFLLAISIYFFLAMFHLKTIFTAYIERTKEAQHDQEIS